MNVTFVLLLTVIVDGHFPFYPLCVDSDPSRLKFGLFILQNDSPKAHLRTAIYWVMQFRMCRAVH